MSLTSMLKSSDLRAKDFKEHMKTHSPSKDKFTTSTGETPFSTNYPLLVPNELSGTEPALTGIAFDYLARFTIARVTKNNKAAVLDDLVCSYIFMTHPNEPGIDELFCTYENYKDQINDYINGKGPLSNSIIEGCWLFANIELVHRSHYPLHVKDLLRSPSEHIVCCIQSLHQLFIERFITSGLVKEDSIVYYNPNFGSLGREAFGGADADIVIDGTLVDFKTGKKTGYVWQDVAQLYGYYMLYLVSKKEGLKFSLTGCNEIHSLSIYRARFGLFETVKIVDLDKTDIEASIKYFKDNYGHIIEHYKK